MSIETDLKSIADHLARIADALEQKPSPTPENVIRISDKPIAKPVDTPTEDTAAKGSAPLADNQPDTAISIEVIREALKTVAAKYGKAAAQGILAEYNAAKIPDVKTEDYDAFYNACQAQLQDKAA